MITSERQARFYEAWRDSTAEVRPRLDLVRARMGVVARREELEQRRARLRWSQRGLALLAACALLVLAVRGSWRRSTTFTVAGQRGDVGEWLATNGTDELDLTFSEGTQVALESGSRGRVEDVTPEGARVVVERGSLRAQVTHRPGAAWRFGAGPFDVQVTGTSLDVSWDPDGGKFTVGVSRGSVVVRGPYVTTPQEVRAGERCDVDLRAKTMQLVQIAAAAPQSNDPPPASSVVDLDLPSLDALSPGAGSPPTTEAPTRAAPASAKSWLALAQAGRNEEAIAAATRTGLTRIYQSAPSEDLVELARAARLSGRSDIERGALMASRNRFTGQPAGARAAYLLGRSATGAGDAAQWFETYLSEQPSGVLAREAAGRVIESYQRLGNRAAARDAATRYLATYGDGPHASLARQVLSSNRGDGG